MYITNENPIWKTVYSIIAHYFKGSRQDWSGTRRLTPQELVILLNIFLLVEKDNSGKYLHGEQFAFFLSHKCLYFSSKTYLSPAQIAGVEARSVTLKNILAVSEWPIHPKMCPSSTNSGASEIFSKEHKASVMQLAHISPVVSGSCSLKCSGFLIRRHLSCWSQRGESMKLYASKSALDLTGPPRMCECKLVPLFLGLCSLLERWGHFVPLWLYDFTIKEQSFFRVLLALDTLENIFWQKIISGNLLLRKLSLYPPPQNQESVTNIVNYHVSFSYIALHWSVHRVLQSTL